MNKSILDHNTFGYIFGPEIQIKDDGHLYVEIINQDVDTSNFVRRLEPDLPPQFNNILVKTLDCSIFSVPYTIKYVNTAVVDGQCLF
jgi:hypothetical protein